MQRQQQTRMRPKSVLLRKDCNTNLQLKQKIKATDRAYGGECRRGRRFQTNLTTPHASSREVRPSPSVAGATDRVIISTGAQAKEDEMLELERDSSDSELWLCKAEVFIGKAARATVS